jgi:hypothetical protein
MGQTAIFVDGGYFDRVSRDCGSPRIDFGKLATSWRSRTTCFAPTTTTASPT